MDPALRSGVDAPLPCCRRQAHHCSMAGGATVHVRHGCSRWCRLGRAHMVPPVMMCVVAQETSIASVAGTWHIIIIPGIIITPGTSSSSPWHHHHHPWHHHHVPSSSSSLGYMLLDVPSNLFTSVTVSFTARKPDQSISPLQNKQRTARSSRDAPRAACMLCCASFVSSNSARAGTAHSSSPWP